MRVNLADGPRRGSVEINGGVMWDGGFDVASLPAELTANAGNQAPPVTLFNTDATIGAVAGVQARVGFFLSSAVSFEGGIRYNRPELSIDISDDFEQTPALTIDEKISRYVFDGSLVFHPERWRFGGGRGMPFVLGGAGYLRELHDGRELVETGRTYHAGAGFKYWMGQGSRRLGFRGEALVVIRDGGAGGDSERQVHPSLGMSLSYLF